MPEEETINKTLQCLCGKKHLNVKIWLCDYVTYVISPYEKECEQPVVLCVLAHLLQSYNDHTILF